MVITRDGPDTAETILDTALLAELIRLASTFRHKSPSDVASTELLAKRHDFIRNSVPEPGHAETLFERVIGGDELQPISYLERGAKAARAVARVRIGSGGWGTGFLIAPRVLITNNHVLGDAATAGRSSAQFQYEVDISGAEIGPIDFRLMPDELFHTSKELDFTVVAVERVSEDRSQDLSQYGCLPLLEVTGKASEGEWLTVIQHPEGARKQICVRENQFLKREKDVIWYSTDTKPGSSGSPVFNNDWFVVALHHSGVPDTRDGETRTNPDGSPKWIANEGIRVSRIVQTLKSALPQHPLLVSMYNMTPAAARITRPLLTSTPPTVPAPPKEPRMADGRTNFPIELRLVVQANGEASVAAVGARPATESMLVIEEAKKPKKPPATIDLPFDDDYAKRGGFDEYFLDPKGKQHRVLLPTLSDALEANAAPLLKPRNGNKHVLHYHNYSLVMHAKRRLAIYSAGNVSFADRFEMSRPPDVWRRDPRIGEEYQLENWYYAANKFDRGHLTRREDLEYGSSPKRALISAADTCHWTNCTPQHERFNQNREIWQGIERYILETSIYEGQVNAQIITGPILTEGDPSFRKIKYPLQFWKVVAALKTDGSLFATAYIASQEEVIAKYGIEAVGVPFGAYKTYQTRITEIERLTGLTFGCASDKKKLLRDFDPLKDLAKLPRRKRPKPTEAAGSEILEGYFEIKDFEDILTELDG